MTYADNGYEVISGLDPRLIENVKSVFADALHRIDNNVINGDLSELILQREAQDHSLVYQASNFVGSSLAASRLVVAVSAQVEASCNATNLHVMPPTVAVQLPKDERFDYKWHQESAFYPWAGQVISVWLPLQPTRVGNGTMLIIPGSHKQGAKSARQYFSHEAFRQIECAVDDPDIAVPMELDVGQYVVFDGNIVHCSDGNRGTLPRLVVIMRFIASDSLKRVRPLYKALPYEE